MRITSSGLTVIAAALALSGALARAAEAQTSYPVVCRGGPTMRLAPEVNVGSTASSRLLVRFARGTRAAVQGVDPGTCAWQDRAIMPAEPAALCFARTDYLSFEMTAAREVTMLRARGWAGDRAVIFWEAGERPDGAAFRIGDSAQYWHFRAYNDGSRGCLLLTQIGP